MGSIAFSMTTYFSEVSDSECIIMAWKKWKQYYKIVTPNLQASNGQSIFIMVLLIPGYVHMWVFHGLLEELRIICVLVLMHF